MRALRACAAWLSTVRFAFWKSDSFRAFSAAMQPGSLRTCVVDEVVVCLNQGIQMFVFTTGKVTTYGRLQRGWHGPLQGTPCMLRIAASLAWLADATAWFCWALADAVHDLICAAFWSLHALSFA